MGASSSSKPASAVAVAALPPLSGLSANRTIGCPSIYGQLLGFDAELVNKLVPCS